VVTLIRLYPLYCTLYYCTLTLTHTCRQPSAPVALSFTFVSDFVFKFYSVHFIGYNFHSTFRLEIISFIPNSVFSVGSKQRATTMLDFEHVTCCSNFFIVIFRSYQPLAAGHPSSHIWYQVIFTLFCYSVFVHVTFQPMF
jgi:hypothetical protein